MKSLWNLAELVQGWDADERGTENSSGRPWASLSSSPSPNPSVPVKASRSGDPIIFRLWGFNPWRFISVHPGALIYWPNIATSRCRPAFSPWVSCSGWTNLLRSCPQSWSDWYLSCTKCKLKAYPLPFDNKSRVNKRRFKEQTPEKTLRRSESSLRAPVTRYLITLTFVPGFVFLFLV